MHVCFFVCLFVFNLGNIGVSLVVQVSATYWVKLVTIVYNAE